MTSKQPKRKPNRKEYSSRSNSDAARAFISILLLSVFSFGVLAVLGYIDLKKKEERQLKLEAARAEAMHLCEEWSKNYPTYTSKLGLFRYSQIDYDGKVIPGKSIYIPDPDQTDQQEESSYCGVNYSEEKFGIVHAVGLKSKYRSESWPCHLGYKLNANYDIQDKLSRKYIRCLADPNNSLPLYSESNSDHFEAIKTWKFDLNGNQVH